jgi:7-cyano-7-deazaguanine synthase
MKNKSLLLLSAGLDSTALLADLKKKGDNPLLLNFDFGEPFSVRELESSRAIAGLTDSRLEVFNVKGLMNYFGGGSHMPNPGNHVLELGSLIILSLSSIYAHRLNINKIYIGYTKLDAESSNEYNEEFLKRFSSLINYARESGIEVIAPLIKIEKNKVLNHLDGHEDLLKHTWSCMYGAKIHCGTCQACLSRKKAFFDAGIKDPTKYES